MPFQKLFTVNANEKITDKALRRVLIVSVCSILLCMSCLVGTTWAWYTTTFVSEESLQIGKVTGEVTAKTGVLQDKGSYLLPAGIR